MRDVDLHSIVRKVVDSKCAEKRNEQTKRGMELLALFRAAYYTQEELYALTVLRKHMKKLGTHVNYVGINGCRFQMFSSFETYSGELELPITDEFYYGHARLSGTGYKDLERRLDEHESAVSAIRTEANTLQAETVRFVDQFRNVKALAKAWPEGKAFYEHLLDPDTKGRPLMIPPAQINARLGLSV